jgi:hypothetical protein
MKRTAGALVLLAGLGGCISFQPEGDAAKKTSNVKLPMPASGSVASASSGAGTVTAGPLSAPASPTYPSTAGLSNSVLPAPSYPHWGPASGIPSSPAAQDQHTVARVSDSPQGASSATPMANASASPVVLPPLGQAPNPLPASLVPAVVTPRSATTRGDFPVATPVVLTPGRPELQPVRAINHLDEPERAGNQVVNASPGLSLPPTPTLQKEAVSERPSRPGIPMLRLVNTKQITLNFEVKDVGPSGVTAVDLWYTQDGKDWRKHEAPPQQKPYIIEVDEEGMYGFTLVARSGTGMAKEPPRPGDPPQVWVIVDLTRPVVQLQEMTYETLPGGGQNVAIRWKATDKNIARQAISLYYSEREEGPWKPIATNLENSGTYNWQLPPNMPLQFVVRVEAIDMAGNIGRAQSPRPIKLDSTRPELSIVDVAPVIR